MRNVKKYEKNIDGDIVVPDEDKDKNIIYRCINFDSSKLTRQIRATVEVIRTRFCSKPFIYNPDDEFSRVYKHKEEVSDYEYHSREVTKYFTSAKEAREWIEDIMNQVERLWKDMREESVKRHNFCDGCEIISF